MFKKIWNFFTSIKLTIYLGFMFIVVTVIGSFYIQNNSKFFAEIDMHVFRMWLQEATEQDFSKVWWIWAILFILFILAINTFVCSIDKIINIAKSLKNPQIDISPEFIDTLRTQSSLILVKKDTSLNEFQNTITEIENIFKNKKYRTITNSGEAGYKIIYGDKGGWSKFAPYIVHLAFLLVLIGHLISSCAGLKIAGIPLFEGNPTPIPDINTSVKLNRIDFEYTDDMRNIKNYEADISILENGQYINKRLKVNHPVFYKNSLTFYIVTYGFYQNRYPYIIMNITQDFGTNIVFFASLLMLAGLYCTLFITYRRFWIYITIDNETNTYKIRIGGWADNINFNLEDRVNKIQNQIKSIKIF
ncbi:MAG: cytochrome c biogenesis protein ResB [Candidatus Firestonebacteria bacterium]|nr:cytochrome c biogenesis protein ResB [Candidatus Firestonebacteria bacterium]